MMHSYVVLIRWMVIYGYEVPGGAFTLSSTELPRPWSPWEPSPSRKNPHGRTRNRIWALMMGNEKLWTLDHANGQYIVLSIYLSICHTSYTNSILPQCAGCLWPAAQEKFCSRIPVCQALHLLVQQRELHLQTKLQCYKVSFSKH
jgi:hypothetical protein